MKDPKEVVHELELLTGSVRADLVQRKNHLRRAMRDREPARVVSDLETDIHRLEELLKRLNYCLGVSEFDQ